MLDCIPIVLNLVNANFIIKFPWKLPYIESNIYKEEDLLYQLFINKAKPEQSYFKIIEFNKTYDLFDLTKFCSEYVPGWSSE